MDVLLKQVEFVRETQNRKETIIGWVQAGNLDVGYRVKLEGVDDDWWTVKTIYDHGMLKAELHTDRESNIIHEKDHRRKMTGLKLGEVK
jgi:hypothetical protein